TYAYDGDGRRAAKVGSKLYWYGSGGEILAETDAAGNTLNEYVFFGGKRVALVPSSGSALYYAEDLLGSSRVIAQSNGTLCYDADFTPFGGERSYTSTCAQNYKFEGKERDTETQNDDFGAREYTWRFGRWLSADWSSVPVPVPYANLSNPQTLNLYAMVADDPESFADLDGHDRNQPGCTVGDADSCTVNKTLHGMGLPPLTTDQWLGAVAKMDAIAAAAVAGMQQAAAQNQPTSGEGSQANQPRREGIADAAVETKQRADIGQKQYGPNQCSALVAGCISKAGAKAEFDNSGRPPLAGEWANKKANIPGWRPLGLGEKPAPGDVAAVHIREPHPGATGDSAIVVRSGRGLSAIEAGSHGVEYNSLFIHGYRDVVYWRYTGD
ncbi:MAG: RHS repeat-associated core domain-containing protein, partial [Candidatus Sulfotelmatobacter sp.]